MISKNIQRKAIATALLAKGVGPRNCYRLGAVLFKKKQVINAKTNTGKPAEILREFTSFPLLHAETNCVVSHGFDNCSGLDLAIARVHKNGDLSMARPCETCMKVIKKVGIRRIYWTNWEGDWQCEKV